MNLEGVSRKEIGDLGEKVAAEYLRRHGFSVVARNVAKKTGELDIVAKRKGILHAVEVKTLLVREFPLERSASGAGRSGEHFAERNALARDSYSPAENLHPYKIQKVARTAEWYAAGIGWEGELQIDGVLVWLRARDGMAHVEYLPQIL